MVKPYFINKSKTKEKTYLSKKRSNLALQGPNAEVDMLKLKKKINEIMLSICDEVNSSTNDLNVLYESMRKKYLLNEYTPNCLNYINRIITDTSKNHLKKFQGVFELNKIIVSIIKELLMNEFELIMLSLSLEIIDISSSKDINSFKESFIYLCLYIKKLTLPEKNLAPINSFLNRKYQRFNEKFNLWNQSFSSFLDEKLSYIDYVKINERFKEYNQAHSVYCKNNFIDYNLIIDRILTMSIPYNENKNSNLFTSKKIGIDNYDSVLDINNINSTLNNNFQENKININLNSLANNNISQNNNDVNLDLNGKIFTYYNSPFVPDLLTNQNNNIYNKTNMLYQMNSLSNQRNNTNFMNKNLVKPIMQEQEINNDKNITEIKSTGESEINNIKNNLLNEVNKKSLNPKIYFITQEQKNNNDITKDIELKDNSKIQKDITPHDLLHFIGQKVSNEQNNNNNIINYKRNNSNNSITTNIMKNNNENLSLLQSNILGLNTSQQLNDYGQLKYNGNLGFNDINAASQFSFFSSKNQGNFGYNNIFGGQAEENLKQLIGQSSNNFFNSYYSLNGITSSKNFYPHLNNNNYGNGDVQQNINNNNNINCLQINQLGNPISININTANNQPNNEGFFLNNSSNNKNINITNNINNNNIKESK